MPICSLIDQSIYNLLPGYLPAKAVIPRCVDLVILDIAGLMVVGYQPFALILVFAHHKHLVVGQAVLVAVVPEVLAVILTHAPLRAKPQKAFSILVDAVDRIAGQPILRRIVPQKSLLGYCAGWRCHEP
jgi:hypothetical protein